MAAISNTLNTYDVKGIKEDLENVIYNISPEETPFMSNIGRVKATQTLHEWQVDALAAPDTTNAVVEGDDVTSFQAAAPTTRVANIMQISRKTVLVSDTNDTVDAAGRGEGELAYQVAKRGLELRRDMESIVLGNQAAVQGATATARKTGSVLAWLATNVDMGVGGANPALTNGLPLTARTDGTARAFTETITKNVIQKIFTAGGTPKLISLGAANKQVASTFTGLATRTYYQSAAKVSAIIGAADVYVSDFGTLSIVPNRFQRNRDGLFIDTDYAAIVFLRKFKTVKLAKTGDAEKRMLIVEWGLKVHHEAAHGLAADLL